MSTTKGPNKGEINPDEVTLKNAWEILKRILAENEQLSSEKENLKKNFEVEKNIKNHLYAFIQSNGWFDKLMEYERSNRMTKPGGHRKAVACLLMKPPENTN
jgi:hypothetical protein